MPFKNCECSTKLLQIENKINKIVLEITQLKNTNLHNKIQNHRHTLAKDTFTQTFLLDFSETEQPQSILNSINQELANFNLKLKELELKCSILPSLKEKISKQTQIIYFLENKIQNQIKPKIQSEVTSKECSMISGNFQTAPMLFRKDKAREQQYKQSRVYEVM